MTLFHIFNLQISIHINIITISVLKRNILDCYKKLT